MDGRQNNKKKKKTNVPPFVFLNAKTIWSEAFLQLLPSRQILYLNIKSLYNGRNNGKIFISYSDFKDQFSKKTFYDSLEDLEARGWIRRIRKGGKRRFYYLYELTSQHDDIDKPRKPFAAMDRSICEHRKWMALTPIAKVHYLMMKCSRKGWTDGALALPYSRTRALCAPGTSKKARDELIAGEWIKEVSEECGMFGKAKSYKLTQYWDHWPHRGSEVYGKYIQGAKN